MTQLYPYRSNLHKGNTTVSATSQKREVSKAHIAPGIVPMTSPNVTAAQSLKGILAKHQAGPTKFYIMPINNEWATAMLERNQGNRPLREAKAVTYSTVMTEGRWRPHTAEAIKFDTSGVLRDGQHRLRGVQLSDATIPFTVAFGCDPTEADVYDQGIGRTPGDILHQHGIPNANNAAALTTLILRMEYQELRKFDRLMVTNKTDDLWTGDPFFEGALRAAGKAKDLAPPSALGLAYWTIIHRTSRSDRLSIFWEGMASGANLPEKGPILRLRKHLMDTDWARINSTERSIKRAAAVIIAWNAWIERRGARNLHWDFSVKLPEVV